MKQPTSAEIAKALKAAGMRPMLANPDEEVLRMARERPGIGYREMGEATGASQTTLRSAVRRLVKQGRIAVGKTPANTYGFVALKG